MQNVRINQLFCDVSGRMAFEKLTDYDYRGTSYYTAKNLTLSECQGWCRQEPNCLAAAFSFVPNPLTPVQETLCQLQNETQASNPTATAQRAVNMYYMVKVQIRSGKNTIFYHDILCKSCSVSF